MNKDIEILMRELCTRLPYGVMCDRHNNAYELVDIDIKRGLIYILKDGAYMPYSLISGDEVKLYLRPMSSMTKEEKREYKATKDVWQADYCAPEYIESIKSYDWLYANHFDFRGLIEKGLALPAPGGMYK